LAKDVLAPRVDGFVCKYEQMLHPTRWFRHGSPAFSAASANVMADRSLIIAGAIKIRDVGI
jgi:hypothetical protein